MTITPFQKAIARKQAENGVEFEAIRQLPSLESVTDEELKQAVGYSSNIVSQITKHKPKDEFKSRIDSDLYPSFTLRLSKELKDSLFEFSRLENIKPAITVRLAIQEYLSNHIKSLNPAVQNLVKTKW